MCARIIFCISVSLAFLVVILLAIFAPKPGHNTSSNSDRQNQPWLDLSLYIQQPRVGTQSAAWRVPQSDTGALIFRRTLTEGPEDTSRVVGRAQGFVIPVESFARSEFNIVYLSFDTAQYSGSLSVQAKHDAQKNSQELTVVGGTGSFAFARGLAVFAPRPDVDGTYHLKLQLRFPNQSRTIPG